jgi:lipopolysaccharide export LptBFGC system permease protein LptF
MVANILLTSCIYRFFNSFLAPHINKKSEKKKKEKVKKNTGRK